MRRAFVIVSVLGLSALAGPAHAAVSWDEPVRISEPSSSQRALTESVSAATNTNGTAVSIWRAEATGTPATTLKSAFRPGPTNPWGAVQTITDIGAVMEPQVAIDDDGSALAVWISERPAGGWGLWVSHRPGNTGAWSTPEMVSPDLDPAVSSTSGNVQFGTVVLDMNASGQALIAYHWTPAGCEPDEVHRVVGTDGAGWTRTKVSESVTSGCPGDGYEGLYPRMADLNDAGGALLVAHHMLGHDSTPGAVHAATKPNDLGAWSSFGAISGQTPSRFVAAADVDASGNARVVTDTSASGCSVSAQCLYQTAKPVSGAWSGETAIPNTIGWHASNATARAESAFQFAPDGRGAMIVRRSESSSSERYATMTLAGGTWSAPLDFAVDASPTDPGMGVWDATTAVAADGTQHVVYANITGGPGDVDYSLIARSRAAAGGFDSAVTIKQYLDNPALGEFRLLPLMVDGSARPTLAYNWNEEVLTSRGSGTPGSGPSNAAPAVTTTGSALIYNEGAGAVAVDPGVTVDDPDNDNIAGAEVRIASNFQASQDQLVFADQNGISGSYSSGTGVLTLSGSAPESTYQAALRSVKYQNTSDNPSGQRTVSFRVTDAGSPNTASNTASRTVQLVGVDPQPNPQPNPQPDPQPEKREPVPGDPALFPVRPPALLAAKEIPILLPNRRGTACPRKKAQGNLRICTMEDVRKILDRIGLTNVIVLERNGLLSSVRRKDRKYIEHGNVIEQSPDAPVSIEQPNLGYFADAEKPFIVVHTWQDPQLRSACYTKDLATRLVDTQFWPGETRGKGATVRYGAEDLLKKQGCRYRVKYVGKKAGVQTPEIESVNPSVRVDTVKPGKERGEEMLVNVVLPKTEEFAVDVEEGRSNDDRRLDNVVSLVPGKLEKGRQTAPVMPVTAPGEGALVVRVTQANTSPSKVPSIPVNVKVTDPSGHTIVDRKGKKVENLVTDEAGLVVVRGIFPASGNYQIVAQVASDNGLSMDGVGTLMVRDLKSPVYTVSQRGFGKKKGRAWLPIPAEGQLIAQRRKIRSAQASGGCEQFGPFQNEEHRLDAVASKLAEFMRHALVEVARGTNPDNTAYWTGVFINTYLGARQQGYLRRRSLQQFINRAKVEVTHLGGGSIPAPDPCLFNPNVEGLRKLARGFDVKNGALPVVEAGDHVAFPDGTGLLLTPGLFGSGGFVVRSDVPKGFYLTPDERGLLTIAAIASETPRFRMPQWRYDGIAGVIASGGGNVIASGGGNVIASGGGNLTPRQLRGVMSVIASGGGNIIGGENLSQREREIVNRIISEAGGAIISEAGGALVWTEVRALLAVIASGGGNLIGQAGTNLTAGERNILSLIGEAGTNLIGQAGTNFQLDALQGVIASGGGNVTTGVVKGLQAVIASGGGNVIASGGGNIQATAALYVGQFLTSTGSTFLSTNGSTFLSTNGSTFAEAGSNLMERMRALDAVIASGGGNLIGEAGSNLIGEAGSNLIGQAGTNLINQDTGSRRR